MKMYYIQTRFPDKERNILVGIILDNKILSFFEYKYDEKLYLYSKTQGIPTSDIYWCYIEDTDFHNQPERSKREDLDCKECDRIKDYVYSKICTHCDIDQYLDESKMRCSEHCGNTVRDK